MSAAGADPVVFAPATAEHLDAIMALETASFMRDAWSREMMHDEVASVHNEYSVALLGECLVGYAGLRAPERGREADVQTIAFLRQGLQSRQAQIVAGEDFKHLQAGIVGQCKYPGKLGTQGFDVRCHPHTRLALGPH